MKSYILRCHGTQLIQAESLDQAKSKMNKFLKLNKDNMKSTLDSITEIKQLPSKEGFLKKYKMKWESTIVICTNSVTNAKKQVKWEFQKVCHFDVIHITIEQKMKKIEIINTLFKTESYLKRHNQSAMADKMKTIRTTLATIWHIEHELPKTNAINDVYDLYQFTSNVDNLPCIANLPNNTYVAMSGNHYVESSIVYMFTTNNLINAATTNDIKYTLSFENSNWYPVIDGIPFSDCELVVSTDSDMTEIYKITNIITEPTRHIFELTEDE